MELKMILTASRLFGKIETVGNEHCFYCGTECGTGYTTKKYVAKTFTNHDEVLRPMSSYICEGCLKSMSSDYDITMINGEERKSQWVRLYSWIITKEKNIASTKSHIPLIREVVLSPPEPPFSIIISDSGKKQLVFRAVVSFDKDNYPLLLEDEKIIVNINELKNYLLLADAVSLMIGKTALLNCDNFSYAMACAKHDNGMENYEKWLDIKNKKLATLAAWLAKPKGEKK
jgi:CRISPR type IV-associated protein Csf1